ncbi:hypothetical protein DFH08DRAFT_817453 [Mycena albidolilacea]|uniref:Uncharacterized protein n=1 Tax=Mycena albidolilacea TaxID=1033008 RepID=A0AAD7EH00_9AGAR|nr:hypothetical protein DFH08DRAFT_817453 [Mycena albidolilacea]
MNWGRAGMRERDVDGGRYAVVYSVVEDPKEEDGKPSRSSAKIKGTLAARAGNLHTRSETRFLVYAKQVRREHAVAVVRGEGEKGRCSTLKQYGGRDAHGGRVGDWNWGKDTESAQKDDTRQRVTHLKYAHFAPPPIFSEVYKEGLFPDKLQAKSAACAFTKKQGGSNVTAASCDEVRQKDGVWKSVWRAYCAERPYGVTAGAGGAYEAGRRRGNGDVRWGGSLGWSE